MNKFKGFINPLIAVGVLLVGIFVLAVVFGPKIASDFGILSQRKEKQESNAAAKESAKNKSKKPSPTPTISPFESPSPVSEASPSPATSPNPSPSGAPIIYKQPQGKYVITLPAGWKVDATSATTTYSTTKFTSSIGYIAITFGSGKDPLGGCSETSSIVLADRTIDGCLLLQKDGSQILTRVYTKDSAGIQFTIEAFINSPNSVNLPTILGIIKTIDIN